METTPAEVIYVPENVNGKAYMGYQRFKVRVCVCSGIWMLIVLSAAVALIVQILNFSTFLSRTYDLAEGDMRSISVSTAFCEEISLGKDTCKRNLWIVPSLRTSSQLRRTNISTEVLVSKYHYWYKGFYLLEGSSIVVNAESDSMFKLFIFKDKKRLNEWIKQNDGTQKSADVREASTPTRQPTRISYILTAHQTESYFVLFKYTKGENDFARMKLDMKINRKVYDLKSSVYSCSAGAEETCSARLLFGSSEVGVLEVTDELSQTSYRSNELVATWHCKPRIWFYLAVFVGPIVLAVVVSFIFYFVFISRKREKHLYRLAARRQQALRRASAAGHSANRSLNDSMRRPPSRTPSTRSLGNQTDMSRAPCLPPVVTSMYMGNEICASEDSGHDTDEENKQNNQSETPSRKSSLDGISLASKEITVSRKPSFSTFQGSEDEARASRCPSEKSRDSGGPPKERRTTDRQEMRRKVPTCAILENPPTRRYSSDELYDRASRTLPYNLETAASRNLSERLRDIQSGKRSSSEKARKPRSEGQETRDKIPNGTIPGNSPTRRYSSDELYQPKYYERATKSMPRNHVNTEPEFHMSTSRNLSRRLRENASGGRSAKKKARKPSQEEKTSSLGHDTRGEIPNGTIPSNSPTRRNSSDELYNRGFYDHANKMMPSNRGNTLPASPHGYQLSPERYLLSSKPSSLPSLQHTDDPWELPIQSTPDSRPGGCSSGDENSYRDNSFAENQSIKLRAQSWRRREMGWTPRLSMVSESEV